MSEITRIVRMTFRPDAIATFLEMFEEVQPRIRAFPGCTELELWNDVDDERTFFTTSKWDSVEHLEQYRGSDLFVTTWEKTKTFFEDSPQAWSVVRRA
jgi:quinol monooxygenase YgiN